MSRIILSVIFWTLSIGVPSLQAQQLPDERNGITQTSPAPVPTAPLTPKIGDAAGQDSVHATWRLGRTYADRGDHARAFAVFRRIADACGQDSAGAPYSRIVANTFVLLGKYYLKGIPDALDADPNVAQEFFLYAASYFADPEAQYELGRLLLNGQGVPRNAMQAARWLNRSAKNGNRAAQAMLGNMLLKGDGVLRQAPLGLFWLMLANDGDGSVEKWIAETYKSALAQTTEEERVLAYKHLEDWLKDQGRSDNSR